jgi:hypothetical protein
LAIAITLGEPASFSTTCWKYYSAVVGKILNFADGFFCGGTCLTTITGQGESYTDFTAKIAS